jgi:pimeloyl-ACP methyl ester carboxylesterase
MDSADPILLLHGSASSGAMWRRYLEPLATLGYRALAPDLIGWGAAGAWHPSRPFRLDDEIDRLLPLVPRNGRRWHLVGHSYGGLVALGLAAAAPEGLASLTLIEPVAFSVLRYAGETAAYADVVTVREAVTAALDGGHVESALRSFLGYWAGPAAWDSLAPRIRAELLASAPKIRLDWAVSFDTDPGLDVLRGIRSRSLLVHGANSPRSTQRLTAALAGILPDARLLVIDGATHLLPLTHASALLTALTVHLGNPAAQASPATGARDACELTGCCPNSAGVR